MRTASTMGDYDRWILIEAALPLLDRRQLDVARALIEGMNERPVHRWRSRAFAAYAVQRAVRGDPGGLAEVERWEMSTLEWWDATAAVLEFQRTQGDDASIGSRVVDAMAALDQYVGDQVTQIELATCLIRALPDVSGAIHRCALGAYLRRLREVSNPDVKITAAAKAGEKLPDPHGLRLLRWASSRLEKHRWDANVNLYFTPRSLGAAFAHKGHVMEALNAAVKTAQHDFHRQEALASVARAATPHGVKSDLVSAYIDRLARSADDALELRCAWYVLLNEHERCGLVETLGAERIRLGHVAWKARCRVISCLVRYVHPADIGPLRDRFLGLVDHWAPGDEGLLARFAMDCASAGHIDAACAALARTSWTDRPFVCRRILEEANDDAIGPLLRELARNPDLLGGQLYTSDDILAGAIARAPADALSALEVARAQGLVSFDELDVALAVRAFELGEEGMVDRVLMGCLNRPLALLSASRRLPVERRRALIDLLRPHFDRLAEAPLEEHWGLSFDWKANAHLVSTVIEVLCATSTRMGAASACLADVLISGSGGFAGAWINILTQEDQVRVAAAIFDKDEYDNSAKPPRFFDVSNRLKWQLPLLDVGRLDLLVKWALSLRRSDTEDHDEALVLLLPAYAALRGPKAALSLRREVVYGDARALSWAAVFGSLVGKERDFAFAQMVPDEFYASDHGALAIGRIAPLLDRNQLVTAIGWIVANHAGAHASVLTPLVESAVQRDSRQAYDAWEAVLANASLRNAEDAVAYLCVAIPVAARLGGQKALVGLELALERASAQWP